VIQVEVIIDASESQLYDNPSISKFEVTADSQAIYALKYLSDMTKAVSGYATIDIEYSTDMPLKLGIHSAESELDFYLAPRIEGGD